MPERVETVRKNNVIRRGRWQKQKKREGLMVILAEQEKYKKYGYIKVKRELIGYGSKRKNRRF